MADKTMFAALKDGASSNWGKTTVGAIILAKTLYDAVGIFRKKEDDNGKEIHRNGLLTTAAEGTAVAAIAKILIDSGRGMAGPGTA